MKFLLDAQLPPSLKQIFIAKGYDCIHTLDLELGLLSYRRVRLCRKQEAPLKKQ